MFRNRLKGGHRVGAPNNLTQHIPNQPAAPISAGGWGMPQQQQQHFGASTHPGQPHQPVHQQQTTNTSGWDNSWNWGENDSYSNNSSQGTNLHQHQQQHHLNPQQLNQQSHALNQQHPQPTLPQYNLQSQAYSQQLQHTSQQQFTKPTQNATYNSQAPSNSSGIYHTSQSQLPTNAQQQYVNGNNQNGEWNNDWGNDNWGNDWGQNETYNNNNKPANYGKQEQQQHQQQQYNQQQYRSQQQQYQHHGEYQQNFQQQQVYQEQNAQQQQQSYQEQNVQQHQQYEQHLQQQQQDNRQSEQYQGEQQNYYQQQQYAHGSDNVQHATQDPQHYLHEQQQQHTQQHEQQQPQLQHAQQHEQQHQEQQEPQLQLEQKQLQSQHQQHTEEEWGWGGDDWDMTKKIEEPEATSNHHQANANNETISTNIHSQEVAAESHDGLALIAHGNASQQVVSRDVAGDGWPDWENGDLQLQEQQQLQQMVGGSTDQSVPQEAVPVSKSEVVASQQPQHDIYHCDDGLVPGTEIKENASGDVSSTSNQHAVVQETSEIASGENEVVHIKQDSWGWEPESVPDSIEATVNSSSSLSVENVANPETGYAGYEHYHAQGQADSLQHMSHSDVETSSTPQPLSENTVDAVGSHDSQASNIIAGPPVTDNWDDDGWGDGWEAEAPVIQEKPVTENSQPNEPAVGEQNQDQHSAHSVNLSSTHHFSEIDGSLQISPSVQHQTVTEDSHSCNSSAAQQTVGEQTYHVNEPPSNAHQFSFDPPYDQGGSASSGWDDGLSQVAISGTASKDVPSDDLVDSVTEGIDAVSIIQENTEDFKSYDPSAYRQSVVEGIGNEHPHEQTEQASYNQHVHMGMYPTSQAEGHPHSSWPSNQSIPDHTAESHQNTHLALAVENKNRLEEDLCAKDSMNVQNQHNLPATCVPEVSTSSLPETMQSSFLQPVQSSQVDSSQNIQPEPELYPQQSSGMRPAVSNNIPHQDHMHQYTSYQSNQYQGLNQEVMEEPYYSQVPDPMVSRIPDGASSVSEVSASITVAADSGRHVAEEPQADGRHSLYEVSDRPSSTHSSHSVGSQPSYLPTHPGRPPSAHAVPERPASNQSAHSVHSVRSTHSVQSAYSNRSTQSSHSLLGQNQEVPPSEEAKRPVSHNASPHAAHLEQNADDFAHGPVSTGNKFASSVASIQESAADGGVDPTAPPSNNTVAPPPVSGPIGTVTSLRARKGSPFQPPPVKRPLHTNVPQAPQNTAPHIPPVSNPSFSDVSANLEMLPDNNEHLVNTDRNAVPLWTSSENLTSNVKLAVAAPSVDTAQSVQSSSNVSANTSDASHVMATGPSNVAPPVTNNPIPLVVPGMMKEEQPEAQAAWTQPDPPIAHNTHPQPVLAIPKVQTLASAAANPTSSGVLDLSRSSRDMNEARGDGSQDKTDTPNFSRMVPGESSKGESTATSSYQAPSVVPSMPSERVVTGNDDPQPVLSMRIKQEPSEVRSPPDGPYTSDLSSQGASVVPPVRSETIGSEEPASRNFSSSNSGSRPDLSNDHRDHRGDRGSRWDRDHSRDRDSRSGDRYRDRSREHSRDYYRDDSPHSRRSYDRDYDFKYDSDRRGWRHDSEDDEDGDRRYYESRDRRDRAYRDELDRYSDRPIKEEKDRSHRESSRDKRRDYRDRSRDYRSYDDDPYYGRSDRSQPVSRSSSINNLDNEGDRSGHSHRSRHDYYDRHDRRDSHSRDSDHRDRDGPYSRNHRDRDSSFSRDGRDPRRDMRYYGQRGYEDAYGSRELYDQYQYYYQYYRDHPYYKEYYRQWMKQYGHAYPSHESFYDDRTSIHSGRSSVNDELKKSISSQFMQDSYGRASVGAYEPSAIYPDGSYSHLKSYASGELSGVPSVGGDSASEAPQRLTPVQHGRPHINARFTPGGGLLFVLPKDPRDGEKAIVQLRDVQKMLCMDPALNRCVHGMKAYPGPLTLADTHKDVVVRYCEQQAADAARNQALPDGDSVTLIWEYLALLVKQNGKLYGSDVAGLLLKGQDKVPQPQHKHSASAASTEDVSEPSPSEDSPQDEGIDLISQSTPLSPPRDESLLLKKFTEYLCLGRKKEAVDYAMREGLWGHALALSFKMDTTTHTRVLAAFSNAIPRNDVLLTLFQQLSGKRPEVTKSYAPQQWGSWRHHLAMMVSNPTGQIHRDKASIVSLGETLASRGQLHAAHFCYLVAEAEWGAFSNKESKLVLIGSSHHLPFQAFATNEAIQCTEIYEFARSLDSTSPVLETFQSYKLIYALRLAEYGFPSEALRYCEVISQIVSKSPSSYQGDFLSQVYELASRLKYHDLHYHMYEGEAAEMPDPQWLSNLRAVVDAVKHQEQMAMQEYYNRDYTASSAYQGSGATPDMYTQAGGKNTTDNYQQGYGVTDASYQQGQNTPDPYQSQVASGDVMDGTYHHQHSSVYPATSQTPAEGVHTPIIPNEVNQSNDSGSRAQESSSPQVGNVPMMMQPQEDQSQYASYGSNYWPGYPPQDPSASSSYMQPDSAEATHSSLPASPEVSSDHRPNSVSSMSQPNSLSSYPPYPQPYQSWEQQQQQQSMNNSTNDEPQSRSPEPSEASQRSPEEEAYWAEMTGKKTSNDAADMSSKEKEKMEDSKKKKDKDLDPSQDKNSGWSIGSLFGWKKSKQAVLPDDKNPSIVWNEEKKRWENKDGGEEVASPPPPPPKMSAGGPGAPPMSLARGGPRKSRYVNTEKDAKQSSNGPSPMMPPPLPGGPPMPGSTPPMPGGAPPMPGGAPPMPGGAPPMPGGAPPMPGGASPMPGGASPMPGGASPMPGGASPMLGGVPLMPGVAPMPPNFMVPAPMPQQQERESSSPQQSQTVQNPEQQIPSQPPAPPSSVPDSSLGTSNDGAEGSVPMMAPPGQPQFFNPNQFNPTSPPNPAQTRRVGPGKRLYQGKR